MDPEENKSSCECQGNNSTEDGEKWVAGSFS